MAVYTLKNRHILDRLYKKLMTGDFNGDGRNDILVRDSTAGEWKVILNANNGFNMENRDYSWLKNWAVGDSYIAFTGDFNGDGKSDLLVWNPDTGNWQIALSDGTRFIPHRGRGDGCWLKNWAKGNAWVPLVGDFDGDGKSDIVVWNWVSGDWQVALSDGEKFIPCKDGKCSWLKPWARGENFIPYVGDFNGDGMDDLLAWNYKTGDWQVALSLGDGFTTEFGTSERRWLKNWAVGDKWVPLIGDFNNDGKDDILVLELSTGGWQLAVSAGRRFDMQRVERREGMAVNLNYKNTLVGDFDGDGSYEVLLVNKYSDKDGITPLIVNISKPVLKTGPKEQVILPDSCNTGTETKEGQSKTRYTIIYPPTVDWNEPIFQRPHQLMAEFARQGHFAIYGNIRNDGKGKFWFVNDNLCISNNFKETMSDPAIRIRMEGTKVVLWKTWPDTLTYRSILKTDIIVYDYIDESTDEFWAWKIKINDCMKLSDVVTVTSKRLFDLTKPLFPDKTFLVRNGADVHQYLTEDVQIPKDLGALKRMYKYMIGFVGTLYTWVDYEIIKGIAEKRPEWGFVFIGPDYNTTPRLPKLSNIHYMGPRKYNELVHYIKNLDAGIIPFEVRNMTHSVNPIKMYEYLACKVPVVTTPISECVALFPYVRTAATADEFVEKIEEAIKLSKGEKEEYVRIAKENSWTLRVKDIITILDSFIDKKKVSESNRTSIANVNLSSGLSSIPQGSKHLSIVSSGFLTPDGKSIATGGVQRYTRDIGMLCKDLGYRVTVHQFGNGYWQREYEGIIIKAYPWKGVNVDWYINAKECIEKTMKEDINKADYVLYMWIGFQHTYRPNSISINHGVWLNIPGSNAYKAEGYVNKYIIPALKQLSALVTVDITFLNICRTIINSADTNKIMYIPNYADIELFKPGKRNDDGIIEILYPRRYDRERGIHIMQEIVPDLLKRHSNVRFYFALGSMVEPYASEWNRWYESQPNKDRIKFGSLCMDEMPAAYKSADIVVLPSINGEGTSFSAMEAMASGKAIVATNVGGLSDIILPGVNGKLTNPTGEDVKRAVEEYINSPEERRVHGDKAAEIAGMAFSKKRWEKQWAELIQSIFK